MRPRSPQPHHTGASGSAAGTASGSAPATASGEPPARPPLPVDPAETPPLDPRFSAALDAALGAALAPLGTSALTPGARAGIEAHARLLLAWNASINLTAVRDPAAVAVEHVVDSLAALPLLRTLRGGDPAPDTSVTRPSLLDLGSGGGFPGIPLALALPAARTTLVDSVGKKARFLAVAGEAAARAMGAADEDPPTMHAEPERAEVLARDRSHRGRYDVVVARAVAQLVELVELCLPFLRPGGWLVAWKRDDGAGGLHAELVAAEPHIPRLGGASPGRVATVRVPGLDDHRLVAIQLADPSPPRYPRPVTERRRALLP